jgi:transcriptional regulator with XRE-family HTH domain
MRTFRRSPAPWRILSDAANVTLGRRVREHRRAAGLSQAALGHRSNVGWRFISEVELGRGNPSLGTMAMIANGLGCAIADLVK